MNKTIQINLGGMPFTLDDNAYRRLDLYLHELKEYFSQSENAGEIMTDIEARLAELLSERLRGRRIVDLKDIADTIRIMGRPGEFENDPTPETAPAGGTAEKSGDSTWDLKTGKRLFRDPNDKVLGGVCSGLAAYFGIQDPIWVRLAFVIVSLTVGFGVLVYLLIWILVPEAKTAADRLAMRGEKANVQNIANMIERGLDDIGDTIKDNWEGIRSKKKRSSNSERTDPGRESGEGGVHLLSAPMNEDLELPNGKHQIGNGSITSRLNRNLMV